MKETDSAWEEEKKFIRTKCRLLMHIIVNVKICVR